MAENDDEDLERALERARLRQEQRAKYPGDMGFYPLSRKFGGTLQKTPWLYEYLLKRRELDFDARSHGEWPKPDDMLAALSRLGADATVHMDRFRGALLGLAVGDALGMPLEFAVRGSRYVKDLEAGGPFNLEEGQWTGDVSMACCLAYSLITTRGFDPKHQMDCYSYWYRYGVYSSTEKCFDIGTTVKTAIDRYLQNGEPYAGSSDPYTAGNGSLVRLAPVVLFYYRDFESAVQHAALSSRTTHQAVEAVDACRYLAALIHGALRGEDKAVLLGERYSPIPGYWDRFPLAPKIDEIARGSYKAKSRDQIETTGYVVHTLEAALWCFHQSKSFFEGALMAANLAGDADSTGAVFGQLAGAYHRETSIPFQWISRTTSVQGFYHFAEDLEQTRPR